MFDKKDVTSQKILDEIENLSREVAELRGERAAVREDLKLSDQVTRLRKELTELEIEKDRVTETHEREKREVTHMVGLEKKRSEQERELATREARLDVRESAVDDKIETFTERLEFVQASLEKQINYLKDDIIKEVFKRLPTVEVNKRLSYSENGHNGTPKEVEV